MIEKDVSLPRNGEMIFLDFMTRKEDLMVMVDYGKRKECVEILLGIEVTAIE